MTNISVAAGAAGSDRILAESLRVNGLDNDVRDPSWNFIRQEEHGARDSHQVRVRALLQRTALVGSQPAVALLCMPRFSP